jgi:hypothetical protein
MRHRSLRSRGRTCSSLPPINRCLLARNTSARDRRAARVMARKRMALSHAGPAEQGRRCPARIHAVLARVGHCSPFSDRHGRPLSVERSTRTGHKFEAKTQAKFRASIAVKTALLFLQASLRRRTRRRCVAQNLGGNGWPSAAIGSILSKSVDRDRPQYPVRKSTPFCGRALRSVLAVPACDEARAAPTAWC